MGRVTLSVAELAAAVTDPGALVALSVHGGVSHVVVEVASPPPFEILGPAACLPGFGLACPVVAVTTPALAGSCAFADVLLAGDGPDGPGAVDAVSRTVDAAPIAAASLALLLRDAETRAARHSSRDAAVLAGLVAESACYSMLQAGAEFAAWRATRPPRHVDDDTADRVRVARIGDTLEITLTRPGRRNALDAAMRDQLADALTIALVDTGLGVRLQGDGPSFSTGGDLDEFGARPDPAEAHVTRLVRSIAWLAHRLAPRMQARIHGTCLGSGIETPAFAARVLAAEDTTMGLPEVSLGLVPGAGGTVSITNRIGRQRTAFLALSGARIDADTARRWGLVDVVHPG